MNPIRLLAAITSLGGVRQSDRSFSTDEVARMFGTDLIFIPGSTATVSPEWQGYLVCFLAGCTVTVPSDLPKGFSCGWSQNASGTVEFVAGAGATLQSFEGNKKSAGQYAMGGIASMASGVLRLYGQLVA